MTDLCSVTENINSEKESQWRRYACQWQLFSQFMRFISLIRLHCRKPSPRRNKAQNLCVQAMDQYDRGDKEAAIDSALQMNAEAGDTENYVIPEQLYTLNTTLDSFESGYRMHYSPLQKVSGIFHRWLFQRTAANTVMPLIRRESWKSFLQRKRR